MMTSATNSQQEDSVPVPIASQSAKRTVIGVFCGTADGASPAFKAAACALAHVFHANNVKMVYGAGTTGMMGEIAKTLVSLSGPEAVHGVIPKALVPKEQHDLGKEGPSGPGHEQPFGMTTVVRTMHERKELMAREVRAGGPGSGFIALSGGFGTLDELAEMTTVRMRIDSSISRPQSLQY